MSLKRDKTSQVDHSCHRILQDLAGKMRESHRILQENTGNIWNMEAVFPPGIFRIFSDVFRKDPLGKHWNLSESTGKKSGKFPVGILLPTS